MAPETAQNQLVVVMNEKYTVALTFVPRGRRYLLCGSDGDDPLREVCGLLPVEIARPGEEDWRRTKSIGLPVRRAADLVG